MPFSFFQISNLIFAIFQFLFKKLYIFIHLSIPGKFNLMNCYLSIDYLKNKQKARQSLTIWSNISLTKLIYVKNEHDVLRTSQNKKYGNFLTHFALDSSEKKLAQMLGTSKIWECMRIWVYLILFLSLLFYLLKKFIWTPNLHILTMGCLQN